MKIISAIEIKTDNNTYSYVLNCLENSQYDKDDYLEFNGSFMTLDDYCYFRIWIDDTVPGYNWSSWVANYTWITGSGTAGDPYIIEWLYIDCEDTGGAIFIYHSQKYFIIRNCWFENMKDTEVTSGVQVYYSRNGVIRDNVMVNFANGVSICHEIYNVLVYNNIMITDNRAGSCPIYSFNCHNCTIKENKALNVYGGIRLLDSDHIILDGNYVENNIRDYSQGGCVILIHGVDDSSIVRNVLAGVFALGYITVSQIDSSGNIITENYVSDDPELKFDFNITLSNSNAQISQNEDEATSFELRDCHNNYIAYNVALIEGSGGGEGIPGYEPLLILGILCVVSIILLKRKLDH